MAPTDTNPALSRLAEQANRFVHAGRYTAARALLAAIRKLDDDSVAGNELDARICIGEGRIDEARTSLDRAIDRAAPNASLFMLRADVRARLDDLPGAAQDASEAVILQPADPRPKAMLGLLLLEQGHNADALACLREAVRDGAQIAAHWQGYAEALARTGAPAEAADALDQAIALIPGHAGLRTAAIMMAMRAREFPRAEALARATRADGIADACIFGLHGHALSHLGRHAEAGEAYQEALKLAPNDVYVRHLVQSAGLLPDGLRAPDEYVETVFDGYADRFEQHLLELGYRVPGLVRSYLGLNAAEPAPLGDILDLGCGTGLVGLMVADAPRGQLAGIDVSQKMLDQAGVKGIYTDLIKDEIGAFLEADPRLWDTVIAADVFCYFGELARVFAAIRTRMRDGARFILSVEELDADAPAEWRLASQGRYKHRADYLARCAAEAGLVQVTFEREILRLEGGAPVSGIVAVFAKAPLNA